MKKALLFAVALLLAGTPARGQKSLTAPGTPNTEDFAGFEGTGFAPSPAPGQLDSDEFAVSGFDEVNAGTGGACNFGDTCPDAGQPDNTDFSRGLIPGGGNNAGGIYAMDHGGGDVGLGVQPKADDFTPGDITIKYRNDTGAAIEEIELAYEVWYFNSEAGIDSLGFSYATGSCGGTGDSYTAVPSLAVTTPETADAAPEWQEVAQGATLALSSALAPDDCFFARFTGDAVKKPSSQDEIAIDDVVVTAIGLPADFCPRTPRYWLEHQDGWPVDHLTLGGRDYDREALLALLADESANPSTRLARQLAAAKLNLAAGSDDGIQPVVEAADRFLYHYPPGTRAGDRREILRRRVVRLTRSLEDYNAAPCEGDVQTALATDEIDLLQAEGFLAGAEEPKAFTLEGNYPNPFNPRTTIGFDVPETARIRLSVYDVLGREVATLIDGVMQQGRHRATFDAGALSSGTYLYRLETPQGTFTKTMVLHR